MSFVFHLNCLALLLSIFLYINIFYVISYVNLMLMFFIIDLKKLVILKVYFHIFIRTLSIRKFPRLEKSKIYISKLLIKYIIIHSYNGIYKADVKNSKVALYMLMRKDAQIQCSQRKTRCKI